MAKAALVEVLNDAIQAAVGCGEEGLKTHCFVPFCDQADMQNRNPTFSSHGSLDQVPIVAR